jgi:hypothetical protein
MRARGGGLYPRNGYRTPDVVPRRAMRGPRRSWLGGVLAAGGPARAVFLTPNTPRAVIARQRFVGLEIAEAPAASRAGAVMRLSLAPRATPGEHYSITDCE